MGIDFKCEYRGTSFVNILGHLHGLTIEHHSQNGPSFYFQQIRHYAQIMVFRLGKGSQNLRYRFYNGKRSIEPKCGRAGTRKYNEGNFTELYEFFRGTESCEIFQNTVWKLQKVLWYS